MRATIFTATLILIFFCNGATAQFTNSGTIDSCFDLQKTVFTPEQISVGFNISYAGNTGISDFYSFDDVQDNGDVHCNSSTGCDVSLASLIYDVYYPAATAYTQYSNNPLPAIFMFHSGGFSDCTNKDNDNIGKYCEAFARRGFITFNIEYRRGIVKDRSNVSPEQILATYRTLQDARGAIKSIIKRQLNNETVFKIDTSKLFIGGTSAGAIIALATAFYDQQEIDDVMQGISDAAILGPLDKDDYYGSVNTPFSLKAVLSMWGGLIENGNNDSSVLSLIKPTDNIAVIAFHGEADSTIPYRTQRLNLSTGAAAKAKQCGFTYKIPTGQGTVIQHASASIYKTLKGFNTPAELYTDSDAPHGLGSKTNYGLATTDKDSVIDYITGRAAVFFQAVNNKIAGNLERTKFRDCKNYRSGCSVADTSCSRLTLSTTVTNITCNGANDGAINLSVLGGSANISFYWTGTGSFISFDKNISALAAGTYWVTATDTIAGTIGTAIVVISEPAVVNASVQTNNVSCFGGTNGSINITATGGIQPYKYSLNNGDYLNNSSFKNIAAGVYKVDVKDDRGCKTTINEIALQQPVAALDVMLTKKKNTSCITANDGLIKVNAVGGTALYSYSLNGAAYVSNATFKNLAAGSYTVTARDANNCIDSLTRVVSAGTAACLNSGGENTESSTIANYGSDTKSTAIKVSVLPNPAATVFTLITESKSVEKMYITVTDMYSRKVFQYNGNGTGTHIFGKQFFPGMYILQVVQGKNMLTYKLIKS